MIELLVVVILMRSLSQRALNRGINPTVARAFVVYWLLGNGLGFALALALAPLSVGSWMENPYLYLSAFGGGAIGGVIGWNVVMRGIERDGPIQVPEFRCGTPCRACESLQTYLVGGELYCASCDDMATRCYGGSIAKCVQVLDRRRDARSLTTSPFNRRR
jgi:hypothetical protein